MARAQLGEEGEMSKEVADRPSGELRQAPSAWLSMARPRSRMWWAAWPSKGRAAGGWGAGGQAQEARGGGRRPDWRREIMRG